MWKLLLHKFGRSLLTIGALIVGIFCWGLTIYPFNLPYLLHLPAEETDGVIAIVFTTLFVSVATVIVRTNWCIEEDLFWQSEDEPPRPLFLRVLRSREWLADVIVFAVWALLFQGYIGITSGVAWHSVVLVTVMLVAGSAAAFAPLDCLLYVLARKRADRRLRRLQRSRDE